MKHFKFYGVLFFAAMLFFLISCGGGESKEESSADSTTAESNTTAVLPEVNTIITTPQNMMVVTHKVSDFDKFKPAYDEHDSLRLVNGIHSYVIGRGIDDPNMVLVAVKCDDMAKAKAFAKDASLKKAMQKSGVTGTPSFTFVTTVWQDKQERLDNGITVRSLGHDADNNKKVFLVTALTDTAKAHAYWKSDALKKRREAGGVIGEPKRFVFRVVHRY